MTDPASWPTTPPTEPGWYWRVKECCDGHFEEPAPQQIVQLNPDDPALFEWFERDSEAYPLRYDNFVRWRPGRIEP